MQTPTTAAPAAVTTSHDKVGAGTTARHTPGPWIADTWGGIWADSGIDRHGERTVDVCQKPTETSDELWRANALLIAAAPDLLAALKNLICHEDRPDERMDFPAARRAIAKAEGRS